MRPRVAIVEFGRPRGGMCSPRWRARTRPCAGPQSRRRRRTMPRKRSTASPSRRTCSTASADGPAAILDRRLGRAAEPRDQLSHRVCRGAERPAPGWLHASLGAPIALKKEPEEVVARNEGIGRSANILRKRLTMVGTTTNIGNTQPIRKINRYRHFPHGVRNAGLSAAAILHGIRATLYPRDTVGSNLSATRHRVRQ